MKILTFSDASLQEALYVLAQGGVVAHATETCYGFACDLSSEAAVEKLFAIKQRPQTQLVSGLFASVEQVKEYVEWNDEADALAQKYLPGPLTLILPMRSDAPKILYPCLHPLAASSVNERSGATIGVRISSHPHAHALATAFGSPLSTSSANIHGQPNPYSVADIEAQFTDMHELPDLILDSGTLPQNPPSTILDLTSQGSIRRQGSILHSGSTE